MYSRWNRAGGVGSEAGGQTARRERRHGVGARRWVDTEARPGLPPSLPSPIAKEADRRGPSPFLEPGWGGGGGCTERERERDPTPNPTTSRFASQSPARFAWPPRSCSLPEQVKPLPCRTESLPFPLRNGSLERRPEGLNPLREAEILSTPRRVYLGVNSRRILQEGPRGKPGVCMLPPPHHYHYNHQGRLLLSFSLTLGCSHRGPNRRRTEECGVPWIETGTNQRHQLPGCS